MGDNVKTSRLTSRFIGDFRIQLANTISCTAVAMTVLFPSYCLWTTPWDAFAVYQECYQFSPSKLPDLTMQIGRIPLPVLALLLIVITAAQIFITFKFRPRIWVGLLQLCLAACCVIFAWLLQLALLGFPMIKLFNEFS